MRLLTLVSLFAKKMRLLSKFLWLLAFLAATFCWMVLFEHGFSVKAFSEGVRTELRELLDRARGHQPAPPEPPAGTAPEISRPTLDQPASAD